MSQTEGLRSGVALAKRCDASVLILGQTGTGKSTLARLIHEQGGRANGPFVNMNLASVHDETMESTLFGHERGAFTSADRARVGRLELADRGTLFLDEIAELPLSLQARLLEFLQSKTFTPLGSNREKRVDVRVICATNRDLQADVRAGRFRADLYHRIRVLSLELSPLESLEDEAFSEVIHRTLERICEKLQKSIVRMEKEVAELFECYSWPGNFRELENVLEVAVLTSEDGVLKLTDLPSWFTDSARLEPEFLLDRDVVIRSELKATGILASAEVPMTQNFEKTMHKFESAVLKYFITRNGGNLAQAARETGLSKATFYRKAHEHQLVARPQA